MQQVFLKAYLVERIATVLLNLYSITNYSIDSRKRQILYTLVEKPLKVIGQGIDGRVYAYQTGATKLIWTKLTTELALVIQWRGGGGRYRLYTVG